MKDSQGLFVYTVTVESAIYNSANHRWEYIVRDHEGKLSPGTVKETDLKGE